MNMPPMRFLDRRTPPHLATLILLAGVSAMSMNVFLPSLPNMAVHFGVDYAVMQLSVSLYLAASALLQVVIGPLSDRYGRRALIIASLIIFLLATVGTLLATTAEVFLIFRTAQSVIATGMVLSRAIARDMVDEANAASMIGYVTMGMSVAPMLGPIIGGMLDAAVGWQGSFVLLFVLGAALLALVWADLGETAPVQSISLSQQMRQYPELFASPRFWGYVVTSGTGAGVFFAYLGGGPFVGIDHFGLSTSTLGFFFGFTAVGYGFGNFLSGRYSVRMGINRMMIWGSTVAMITLLVLAFLLLVGLAPVWVFFGMFIFLGIGNGVMLPNTTAGMLSVRPHLAGTASGIGQAFTIGLGAVLAAIAGALLTPGAGPWPLVLIMLCSATASFLSALFVIARAKRVGA